MLKGEAMGEVVEKEERRVRVVRRREEGLSSCIMGGVVGVLDIVIVFGQQRKATLMRKAD